MTDDTQRRRLFLTYMMPRTQRNMLIISHPQIIPTTCQLKEKHYSELVKAIRLALRVKKKLRFVDGLIPKTKNDDVKEEEW